MKSARTRGFRFAPLAGILFAAAAAPLAAQTAVLASLTVKPDTDRARVMKVMPDEIRATVQLYLRAATAEAWCLS